MQIPFLNRRNQDEKYAENSASVVYTERQIKSGEEFPPAKDRARIARYRVMKKVYEGKRHHVLERATKLLEDTPHAEQLRTLRIAVNLADIIATKPADMLAGEPPQYETGLEDSSPAQTALNSYVEENDLTQLIHESAIGAGIRGDAFLKVRFGYRQDYWALREMGIDIPADAEMEPIIEHVAADIVFPEVSAGNVKHFRAIDIAQVEYVETAKTAIPFLNVERHVPGYIIYERYRLIEFEGGVDTDNEYNYPVQVWQIGEKVETGREENVVATGIPHLLVKHVPYKTSDYTWEGVSGLKSTTPILQAIQDRLAQIDYILWKHSDPAMYGPEVESPRGGGIYIPITQEDQIPGYMTWNSQLDGAFKELETLIGMVFQLAETPQWLFGTVLGDQNAGGTGTSHTDSAAIKARFMPILSKVARIRSQYDRAIRDALYYCQLLDVEHGDASFTPVYPTISWTDGLPRNEKEEAEIMSIRTGGKETIDVHSAIKRLDRVDDEKAKETIRRIESDTDTVDASIFNQQGDGGKTQ